MNSAWTLRYPVICLFVGLFVYSYSKPCYQIKWKLSFTSGPEKSGLNWSWPLMEMVLVSGDFKRSFVKAAVSRAVRLRELRP